MIKRAKKLFDKVHIQEDLPSRMREWFSPGHSGEVAESSHDVVMASEAAGEGEAMYSDGYSGAVRWRHPSSTTREVIAALYEMMFIGSRSGATGRGLDLEQSLASCPPDENILVVEDQDHYNLLEKAIIFDDVPAVQVLLCHGCDANWSHGSPCSLQPGQCCPHAGLGPLHLACFLGRTDIVKVLLRWGADRCQERRVYPSAVIRCPAGRQPHGLGAYQPEEVIDILSKCGDRLPVFYSILRDNCDVLRIFIGDSCRSLTVSPKYGGLIPLACRVGAYDCLHYLLNMYPAAEEKSRLDSDGLPPVLMAMRHGLRFCCLLIRDCHDVAVTDNLWESGANILHFLFRAMPYKDHHVCSLRDVMEVCIQLGARLNSRRGNCKHTPLHDLLTQINAPISEDLADQRCGGTHIYEFIACFDQAVIECAVGLVSAGADANLQDATGRNALGALVGNTNHKRRCQYVHNERMNIGPYRALSARKYGLDNTLIIARFLLRVTEQPRGRDEDVRNCLISDLVESMCYTDMEVIYQSLAPSLERLSNPDMLEGYMQLFSLLLDHGYGPNATPEDRHLPPLLSLLSSATCPPYLDDYVISAACAHAVCKLVVLLVEYGAQTEVVFTRGGCHVLGCFDVLTLILKRMMDYPQSRDVSDFRSLEILTRTLLRHGAKTFVYQNHLFTDVNEAFVPGCPPTGSLVLYQLLQFGAFNLQYAGGDSLFWVISDLVADCSQQPWLAAAVGTTRLTFSAMHDPMTCSCGLCPDFHARLVRHLANARSLKQLARLAIRAAVENMLVGPRFGPRAVDSFRLPTSLKKYLLFIED